jgi:hypothetical protein
MAGRYNVQSPRIAAVISKGHPLIFERGVAEHILTSVR